MEKFLEKLFKYLKRMAIDHPSFTIGKVSVDLRWLWKFLFKGERFWLRKRINHSLKVQSSRFGFKIVQRKK